MNPDRTITLHGEQNGCIVVDAKVDSLIESVINLKKRVNADLEEATQVLKLPFSCQIFCYGIQFYR